MMLTIVRAVETSIVAPNQWDAWTADGTQLYLRYRHGRGRVELLDETVLSSWSDGEDVLYCSLPLFCARSGILRLDENADITDYPHYEESTYMATPAPVAEKPTPIMKGKFALFSTPDNSIILAYRPEGEDADKQLVIPSFIVSTATQMAGSGASPEAMIGRLKEMF